MLKIGTKIVCWTDLHLGLRNNEKRHNDECLEFIKWMHQEAQIFGADYSMFLGDFFHNRSSIQANTLNYANTAFKFIDKNFKRHFHITGNHDMFFREKRDVTSVIFAENLPNIQLINEITKLDDSVLCPYLVGNEHKKVSKLTQPYIFGHFELPHFLMNSMVAMPDVGTISQDDFKSAGQSIFSGHFHKRQTQINTHGANISYIGNCFPHNFSDVGDDERGIMLLEVGQKPIYKTWPNAPKYRQILLSELIQAPDKYLDDKTTAKVHIDMDLSYEEANEVKETFTKEYNVRELRFIPSKVEIGVDASFDGIKFQSVDQVVQESITSIESTNFDKGLILDIWNSI